MPIEAKAIFREQVCVFDIRKQRAIGISNCANDQSMGIAPHTGHYLLTELLSPQEIQLWQNM